MSSVSGAAPVASATEDDEAFARRLQLQEGGNIEETPLVRSQK